MSSTNEGNILISDKELETQIQQTRQLYIKIEILNTNDDIIDEVSGECIGGTYNINADAAIRRTCAVEFRITNKLLPSEKSVFWINKRFRLYIGITHIKTQEIIWFKKGTYAIQDPSIQLSITDSSIIVNGLDKMALHTGDISGQLSTNYLIKASSDKGGTYVHQAIKALMEDGGETNMKIDETSLLIPYDIEKNMGETRYDVLNELVNLFYNYQVYYNLNGVFIFNEKPTDLSSNIECQWDFAEYNLMQSIEREIQYSNIKNNFIVYGGVMDNGSQASYHILLTDDKYPNCPYTQTRLCETFTRDWVIQEDAYIGSSTAYDTAKKAGKIDKDIDEIEFNIPYPEKYSESKKTEIIKSLKYATQLCKNRAKEELYYHQQSTDTIKFTCLPIYSLDVNNVINVYDEVSGAIGKYVVREISCGLSSGDVMNVTAIKLW